MLADGSPAADDGLVAPLALAANDEADELEDGGTLFGLPVISNYLKYKHETL